MSYYNRDCNGDRADIDVALAGGVRMTLHCENDSDYGYHWRDGMGWDSARNETVTGTPHRSSLRLPGTRIEFEWAEGDSTND